MFKDTFDKISWSLLITSITALIVLLVLNNNSNGKPAAGLGKAVERDMAYRAKIELIDKLYGPVDLLRSTGQRQESLLKLDELIRKYPGEAHGHILQGQILMEMGALEESLSSFVAGVKLNGDYVDDKSPLSRRGEIQKIVDETFKSVGSRAAANPGNRTLAATIRKANYLKSRLAGGCE